jgi:hypothetical protein
MFLVWQCFAGNLLSVVLVLFPDIFVNFGLKPGRIGRFPRAIKIRSMNFFGREIKPSVHWCEVLWPVKEAFEV